MTKEPHQEASWGSLGTSGVVTPREDAGPDVARSNSECAASGVLACVPSDEEAIEQDAPWEITRLPGRAAFPLLEEMWIERGDKADWDLLAGLHYKMNSLPVGAKHYRVRLRGETIGVCVFGQSKPLLKERHAIFPRFKPGNDTQLTNIYRYDAINGEYRTIGRLVVDTMYRSAGIAYRLANLASRMHGYRYAEIMSSMAKYNFFAQRAGFTMVKPIKSHYHDKGLKFMRRYFSAHPGDQEALMEEFRAMSPALQRKTERDLKTFYFDLSPLEKTGSRRFYSEGVVDNWPFQMVLSKIQGLCFASPLYGIYKNPDPGPVVAGATGKNTLAVSILPARLPLLAFDLQPPDQPLAVTRLQKVPGWAELEPLIEARNWSAPTILPPGFEETEEDQEEAELAEVLQDHSDKLGLTDLTGNPKTEPNR